MTATVDMAQKAQEALRASGNVYRLGLLQEIFDSRNDVGLRKMLELAKDLRAKALFSLANGSKDAFEANQATWKAWEFVVNVIESGPKARPEVKT